MIALNSQLKKSAAAVVLGAGAFMSATEEVKASGSCYNTFCSYPIALGTATIGYQCTDPMPQGDDVWYCQQACNSCAWTITGNTSCSWVSGWQGNFRNCENNTMYCDCFGS